RRSGRRRGLRHGHLGDQRLRAVPPAAGADGVAVARARLDLAVGVGRAVAREAHVQPCAPDLVARLALRTVLPAQLDGGGRGRRVQARDAAQLRLRGGGEQQQQTGGGDEDPHGYLVGVYPVWRKLLMSLLILLLAAPVARADWNGDGRADVLGVNPDG